MKTWQIMGMTWLVAGGLAACAHSGDSAVLQYRGSLEPQRAGDQCVETDQTRFVGLGTLDLALAKNFRIFPFLQSMMVHLPVAGENPSQIDTNTINLTSMTVTVDTTIGPNPFVKGNPFGDNASTALGANGKPVTGLPVASWKVPITGTVTPLGFFIGAVDLVPDRSGAVPIGDDWRSRFFAAANSKTFSKVDMVLSFQIEGVTVTGDNVITDAATIPLRVCYGCLLTPVTFSPSTSPLDYYAGCGTGAPPDPKDLPCIPGQDDFVPCTYYCHICQQATALGDKVAYNKCVNQLCLP
jgi:hypothetical protein